MSACVFVYVCGLVDAMPRKADLRDLQDLRARALLQQASVRVGSGDQPEQTNPSLFAHQVHVLVFGELSGKHYPITLNR